MVSEATNALLAGVIAGWLIAGTQPIIRALTAWLKKHKVQPRIAITILIYLFWLLIMMALVVWVYG